MPTTDDDRDRRINDAFRRADAAEHRHSERIRRFELAFGLRPFQIVYADAGAHYERIDYVRRPQLRLCTPAACLTLLNFGLLAGAGVTAWLIDMPNAMVISADALASTQDDIVVYLQYLHTVLLFGELFWWRHAELQAHRLRDRVRRHLHAIGHDVERGQRQMAAWTLAALAYLLVAVVTINVHGWLFLDLTVREPENRRYLPLYCGACTMPAMYIQLVTVQCWLRVRVQTVAMEEVNAIMRTVWRWERECREVVEEERWRATGACGVRRSKQLGWY